MYTIVNIFLGLLNVIFYLITGFPYFMFASAFSLGAAFVCRKLESGL